MSALLLAKYVAVVVGDDVSIWIGAFRRRFWVSSRSSYFE